MPKQLISFLIVSLVCTLLVSCDWLRWRYKEGMREDFRTDLRAAVREGREGAVLNLADVTTFEWDVVHIFGPYPHPKQVERVVGSPVHEYELPSHEGDRLLVFLNEGRVVLDVELNRECNFLVVDTDGRRGSAIEVAREEARFRVKFSEHGACQLEPLNVRMIHNPVEPRPARVPDVPGVNEASNDLRPG